MITLPGTELPVRYLPKLDWVRDLQYYQGPLLAEFRARDERYLYRWCDVDDSANRWLVVRVEPREVFRLTAGLLSIKRLLHECLPDKQAFLVDIDDRQDPQRLSLVTVSELPVEYVPAVDAPLNPRWFPKPDREHFPLILSDDWGLDEANATPRRFMDLFSLLAQPTSRRDVFKPSPMRDGYSTVNFFATARARLGSGAPEVDALQFASPGYVHVRGDRATALRVVGVVDHYRQQPEYADGLYREVQAYIRHEKLNADGRPALMPDQRDVLLSKGQLLTGALGGLSWEWVLEITDDAFRAVKVIGAYYRRIRDIARLVVSGRLTLPRM